MPTAVHGEGPQPIAADADVGGAHAGVGSVAGSGCGVIIVTFALTAALHPPVRADATRAALAASATVWTYVLAITTTYACTRGWGLHPTVVAAVVATAVLGSILAARCLVEAVRNYLPPRETHTT